MKYSRRQHDNSIHSDGEGTATANGSLKSVSHEFANPLGRHTAYYRIIIFTVTGLHTHTHTRTQNISVHVSMNSIGIYYNMRRGSDGGDVVEVTVWE